MHKNFLVFGVLLLCAHGFVAAKAPVFVQHSGTDPVGERLSFAVREAIRASSGYELASQSAKSIYRINIVTIDPEHGALAGHATIASIAFTMKNTNPFRDHDPQTWYPIFLSSQVLIAGSRVIEEQAKSILAGLDADVVQLAGE